MNHWIKPAEPPIRVIRRVRSTGGRWRSFVSATLDGLPLLDQETDIGGPGPARPAPRNLQGNLLDPSQAGFGKSSGFVIDATWPLGTTPPPVARVPTDAIEAHPLDRYTIVEV
jgi:hypothetical protein